MNGEVLVIHSKQAMCELGFPFLENSEMDGKLSADSWRVESKVNKKKVVQNLGGSGQPS